MRGRKQNDSMVSSRRPSKAELESRREPTSIDVSTLGELVSPERLSATEKRIWNEVIPQMQAAGLICSLDKSLLIDYCVTSAHVERLKNYLKRHGFFVERTSGGKSLKAEYKLCESLEKKLTRLSDCLELSPKARKNMNISLSSQPRVKAGNRTERLSGYYRRAYPKATEKVN